MGYTTSTVHGIEVPDSSEANNVSEDIGKVVTALEGGSIVRRLTGAQISALTVPQKPAGLLVYNTTTNRLMVSDGSSFINVAPLVRAASISGNYTSGGITVAFASALPSVPTVTISCVPAVDSATPLTVMVYGVTASGFSMRLYSHGTAPGPYGAFEERATGTPYALDYQAIVL